MSPIINILIRRSSGWSYKYVSFKLRSLAAGYESPNSGS